jgi:hypothetical protein
VLSGVADRGWYENWVLSVSECQAIAEYINLGHGLYCSERTLDNSDNPNMQVHVDYLAPLLGLDATLQYDYSNLYGDTRLVQNDLNHPLWTNFDGPYSRRSTYTLRPATTNGDWHDAIADAEIHAISADNNAVVTGLGNRLFVSFYPEYDSYYLSEANYQFLYNALTFAATGGLAWCTTENRSDTLSGNGNVSIPIVFDSRQVDQGEYDGVLVIQSNDPDEAKVKVDLSLKVTDSIAPAAVSDLTAEYVAPTFISLSWTTPGDNGQVGRSEKFEIR